MYEKIYYYDLFDNNGVNTLELPIRLQVGSVFEHEWGTYEVIETDDEYPDIYDRIMCERKEASNE